MAPPEFKITTCLRSDAILLKSEPNKQYAVSVGKANKFYMLRLHVQRMVTAAEVFKWPEAQKLGRLELIRALGNHLKSKYGDSYMKDPLKLRVTLSSTKSLTITSTPAESVSLSTLFPQELDDLLKAPPTGVLATFRILISPVPSKPTLFTTHKTTKRAQYDEIQSRIPSSSNNSSGTTRLATEVLLCNEEGDIMEGCITTAYFKRGGGWFTPASNSGGNLGTTRRWAIDTGKCKEGNVKKDSVQVGEKVILSNGVRGFGWGVVEKLETAPETEKIE